MPARKKPRPCDQTVNLGDFGAQQIYTDVMEHVGMPVFQDLQTTLVVPHTPGTPLVLANPYVGYHYWTGQPGGFTFSGGAITSAPVRIWAEGGLVETRYDPNTGVGAGTVAWDMPFYWLGNIAVGSDGAWPAGTIVEKASFPNSSAYWNNPNGLAFAGTFVDEDGVDTGWPAGLAAGQQAGWDVMSDPENQIRTGNYQLRAHKGKGTGTCRFTFDFLGGTAQVDKTIVFADGVPTIDGVATDVINIPSKYCINIRFNLLASDPGDPLVVHLYQPGTADAAYYIDPKQAEDIGKGGIGRTLDTITANHSAAWQFDWRQRKIHRETIRRMNGCNSSPWFCIPAGATPEFVADLRDLCEDPVHGVSGGRPYYFEYGNENWNYDFQQYNACLRFGGATFSPLRVASLAYSAADGGRGVCVKPGHGFQTGDQVVVMNASEETFNGAHAITRIDADSFSFPMAGPPDTAQASPILWTSILAYKLGAPDSAVLDGIRWHLAGSGAMLSDPNGRGVDFSWVEMTTAADHGFLKDDIVCLTGCADPAMNGPWRVHSLNGAEYQIALNDHPTWVPEPRRFTMQWTQQGCSGPLPAFNATTGIPAELAPLPGKQIHAVKLVSGNTTGPHLLDRTTASQRWNAHGAWLVHQVAAGGAQPSRFRGILAGQAGVNDLNINLMDWYLESNGGPIAADRTVLMCIGAYLFTPQPSHYTNEHYAHDPNVLKFAPSSLTADGTTATCVGPYGLYTNGDYPHTSHGRSTGDWVQVLDADHPSVAGPVQITVTSPTTFTFPLAPGYAGVTGVIQEYNRRGGAAGYGNQPRMTKIDDLGRQIWGVAISGTQVTFESPRHGLQVGAVGHLDGLIPAYYNMQMTIVAVPDANHFTVDYAGRLPDIFMPTKLNDRLAWWIDDSLVRRYTDELTLHSTPGQAYERDVIGSHAQLCDARGFVPACYEIAAGFTPSFGYIFLEPLPATYTAATRSQYMTQPVQNALDLTYKHGFGVNCWYGLTGKLNRYGNYALKQFQGEDGSSRWAPLAAAREAYGHAGKAGPTWDVEPRSVERNTYRTFTAYGDGTAWVGDVEVEAGDGGPIDLVEVVGPDEVRFRYRSQPESTGKVGFTIGGVERYAFLQETRDRSWFLRTTGGSVPYIEAGATGVAVTLLGLDTSWEPTTTLSVVSGGGAVVSDSFASATSGSAVLDAPSSPGYMVLSDGMNTVTVPVVAPGTTPTDPVHVVDDAVVLPGDDTTSDGFRIAGTYNTWNSGGYGNAWRYWGQTSPGNPQVTACSWQATIGQAGDYDVQASWTVGGNHARTVTYTVLVNGVSRFAKTVDQTAASVGAWPAGDVGFQQLGQALNLQSGDKVRVQMSTDAATGFPIADAVRIAWVGEPTAPEAATGFEIAGGSTVATGTPITLTVRLVPPGSALDGARTVNLADDGDGTLSAASLSFADGATASQSFTFTKPTSGPATITATPSPSLGTAATKSVTVTPVGPPLAPGTIQVGVRTRTSIGFGVVGASGGTGPYSIQRQIAPDVAGSPGAWANVGAPNATTPASGLAANTPYHLRAVVADAQGATATTPVVVATTLATGPRFLAILRSL